MAKNKEEKTNVMRTLEQKKIPYTPHTYDPNGPIDGVSVAQALGQDPACVFKTLVTRGASGGYYVFDIPVAEITRQYVAYIEVMHELRFELAAEYLVMAAILAEIKSRMLLPRPPSEEGLEEDPRADLVRRLQEYERFKQAAEDLDALPRQDRDTSAASAFVPDRAAVRLPPPVDLKEMLLALHDVFKRAELFTQHAIKRDALSVRQRMGELLTRMNDGAFHRFESLFTVEEGKLGVVVTFLGLLTLAKEQLIEIVQEAPDDAHSGVTKPPAPIYVKSLALMKDPDEIELSSEFDDAANDDRAP